MRFGTSCQSTCRTRRSLRRYDTHFAAHEVPCDIDYQPSKPVNPQLLGLDYIEAWLAQLLAETRWIAQFDAASCVNVLERACPDYKGLHVNLYDLLLPHENELARTASRARQTSFWISSADGSAHLRSGLSARTSAPWAGIHCMASEYFSSVASE